MFRRHIWSRVHFPELEMRAINSLPHGSFDVAVDVGAAQGLFTWILSRKSRSVYAFEPGETLGRLMRWSTPLSNVSFHKRAVGDAGRTVSLFTPQSGMFGATVSQLSPVATSERVAVNPVLQVTLDETLAGPLSAGRSVDFVKIDVEGYELSVLNGASQVIDKCHPVILCEIELRHNPQSAAVLQHMRAAGYLCYVVRGTRLVSFDDPDVIGVQQNRADPKRVYLNNFLFQHPLSRVDVVTLLARALALLGPGHEA